MVGTYTEKTKSCKLLIFLLNVQKVFHVVGTIITKSFKLKQRQLKGNSGSKMEIKYSLL